MNWIRLETRGGFLPSQENYTSWEHMSLWLTRNVLRIWKTIGAEGIPILMKRLRNERTDVDGSRAIIQLLISITSIAVRAKFSIQPYFLHNMWIQAPFAWFNASNKLFFQILTGLQGSELRTVPLGTPQYENIALFVKVRHNMMILVIKYYKYCFARQNEALFGITFICSPLY